MKPFFLYKICFLWGLFFYGQNYPQNDFGSPLKIPLRLSGVFGELRPNHFHSGIDFRTREKEGVQIYAVADGYVSRIKIGLWGYGKVVYITHTNGYTSVYAHLQKFAPPLEKYIRKIQYREKSFEVQNYPSKNLLKIKKGQVIGYSGTTGGVPPHLHFEIRDTKTEEIINPLLFGLKIADDIPPKPTGIRLYTKEKTTVALPLIFEKKGVYKTATAHTNGNIFFGIMGYDQQNKSPHKNGIYEIRVLKNKKEIYSHRFEKFRFQHSKHLNLLIDYAFYTRKKQRYQKTYQHPKNKLQIYKRYLPEYFMIEPYKKYLFTVELIDFNGNKTAIKIPVEGVQHHITPLKNNTTLPHKITTDKIHVFKKNTVTIYFPRGSVYEDTAIQIDTKQNEVTVSNPTPFPLEKPFTISFPNGHIAKNDRSKHYIARKKKKKFIPLKTKKTDTFYTTHTKTLGSYVLKKDTTPPIIIGANFKNKQRINKFKKIKIYTKDNESGMKEYMATVGGKWVLMEYLPKKDLFFIDVKNIPHGTQKLKLYFTDNCENTTTWEKNLIND